MTRALVAFMMLTAFNPMLFGQTGAALTFCLVNGNTSVAAPGCRTCIGPICDKDENYRPTGLTPMAPSNAVVTGVYLDSAPVSFNLAGYSLNFKHAGTQDRIAVQANGGAPVFYTPQNPAQTFNGQYVEADGGRWETSVEQPPLMINPSWGGLFPMGVSIGNPGFESGTLSTWSVYSPQSGFRASTTTYIGHSGRYSLREDGDTADGVVFQDVSGLTPGKAYLISAWVIPH
jgi:hypothetical protein